MMYSTVRAEYALGGRVPAGLPQKPLSPSLLMEEYRESITLGHRLEARNQNLYILSSLFPILGLVKYAV